MTQDRTTDASPSARRATWRAALLAMAALLAGAGPVGADPAGPSDFRSEVTAITPTTDAIDAQIRGGDSFLELSVEPGHTAAVEGYSGEPYLRFLEDGTVEQNARSEATYLNDDRKGAVDLPPEVDNSAEPDWRQVADDGTYAWHDHRIHWMANVAPSVERGERVPGAYDPWRVPITVDGETVEIQGTLTYASATSPVPWIVAGVAAAAALAWLGRRWPVRSAGAALAAVSALAVVVGQADFAATPDGSGNVLLWLLPAVALAAAAASLALARSGTGVVAALASVAALSGWALLRFGVLLKPVLPTSLPESLDRATVVLALGAAAGAAYLAVTSGALSLPALADDD